MLCPFAHTAAQLARSVATTVRTGTAVIARPSDLPTTTTHAPVTGYLQHHAPALLAAKTKPSPRSPAAWGNSVLHGHLGPRLHSVLRNGTLQRLKLWQSFRRDNNSAVIQQYGTFTPPRMPVLIDVSAP